MAQDQLKIMTLASVYVVSPPARPFADANEALLHLQARVAMREQFYDALRRQPPTRVSHMPSYVRQVQQHWGLQYGNSARRLLAIIEGYQSWEDMMAADDLEDAPANSATTQLSKRSTSCSLGEPQL